MSENPSLTGLRQLLTGDEVKSLYLNRAKSRDVLSSVLPDVDGKADSGGFAQSGGYTGRNEIIVLAVIVIPFLTAFLAGFLAISYSVARNPSWPNAVMCLMFASMLFLVGHVLVKKGFFRKLRNAWWSTGGELIVERWPLRLGNETRVTYRSRPRPEWKTARIEATLRCVESIQVWVVDDSDTRRRSSRWETRTHTMWEQALAPIAPNADPATGVKAAWTIKIPDAGVPSFKTERNAIKWSLALTSHSQDDMEDTNEFELLVRTGAAL